MGIGIAWLLACIILTTAAGASWYFVESDREYQATKLANDTRRARNAAEIARLMAAADAARAPGKPTTKGHCTETMFESDESRERRDENLIKRLRERLGMLEQDAPPAVKRPGPCSEEVFVDPQSFEPNRKYGKYELRGNKPATRLDGRPQCQ